MPGLAQQNIGSDTSLKWNVSDCVTDLSWSPDSTMVVVSDAAGMLTVFDIAKDIMLWSVIAHATGALQVKWRSDGQIISSAGQDGVVKLWDSRTGEVQQTINIGDVWVDHISWSPNGEFLAASAGKTLIILNQQGEELSRFDQHNSTVTAISWKFNSQEVATACYRAVNLFRIGFAKPYKTLQCLGSLINLAWSPDGNSICAGSQDRMLQFWRITAKQGGHAEMKGYPEKVSNLAWNYDGHYLASSGGKDVVIWTNKGKGPAGTKPHILEGHRQRITQMCYQNKGNYLASGSQDGEVRIWQVKKGDVQLNKLNMNSEITGLAWSPNDQGLIAGNKEGQLQHFLMHRKRNN